MKAVFLKGTGVIDYAIRIWTLSPYSHSEFQFSDGESMGVCLTLPPKVTRRRVVYGPSWELVDLDVPIERELKIKEFIIKQLGKDYDWKGIFLSQVLPFKSEDPTKWFCSELCMASFKYAGYFPDEVASKIHPGRFYKCIQPLRRR